MYIRILFVDRSHIELEIACMNNCPLRCIEYNAKAIWNTVVCSKEGNRYRSEIQRGFCINAMQLGLA
ncbi:hypothetical protein D3C75_1079920 [compost metagenome]